MFFTVSVASDNQKTEGAVSTSTVCDTAPNDTSDPAAKVNEFSTHSDPDKDSGCNDVLADGCMTSSSTTVENNKDCEGLSTQTGVENAPDKTSVAASSSNETPQIIKAGQSANINEESIDQNIMHDKDSVAIVDNAQKKADEIEPMSNDTVSSCTETPQMMKAGQSANINEKSTAQNIMHDKDLIAMVDDSQKKADEIEPMSNNTVEPIVQTTKPASKFKTLLIRMFPCIFKKSSVE